MKKILKENWPFYLYLMVGWILADYGTWKNIVVWLACGVATGVYAVLLAARAVLRCQDMTPQDESERPTK